LASKTDRLSGSPARTGAAPQGATISRVQDLVWTVMDQPDPWLRWDALAQGVSEPNPFHESWYLLPALRELDPGRSVRLLRFEHDGELAGLLPVRAQPRYYRWPIPHLGNWIHGNCFQGAPLVTRGLEVPFWRAMLAWADAHAGKSLFLHLAQIPLEGPLFQGLQQVLREQGRLSALVHREERAMLASDFSAQAYFEASLSGKKRKELRRQFARLSELGELRLERRTDDQKLGRWIDEFLALEHSGWKGTAGSALASHQSTARLFRDALAGAALRDKLERLTLYLDDRPLAMLASFLTPPGAFSFKTAFDERYSRFSPGVLLQRENLALLDNHAIAWCDSCAAADHPMIDHIWRERRPIGRLSIAIGGKTRRRLFKSLLRLEMGRNPAGVS
jgi:CelD/BcsL family acetyltransferase involved in cellulose biosynthesis